MIVFILQLVRSYCDYFLALVGMQSLFFSVMYQVLIYENFRFTEMCYTFFVEEGFNRSATYIEQFHSMLQTYINNHQNGVINYIKLSLSSVVVLVLNAMPASVQPMLNMVFSGVQSYQKKAM